MYVVVKNLFQIFKKFNNNIIPLQLQNSSIPTSTLINKLNIPSEIAYSHFPNKQKLYDVMFIKIKTKL